MIIISQLKKMWRNILVLRANGQYKFLIRRWADLSDIDLAANVMGTDFFKMEITHLPHDLSKIKSYLILSPHQDDETIGAGGTMLLAKKFNPRIEILYITDGAAEDHKYNSNPQEATEIRNKEAQKVADELGAKISHLGISNTRPNPTADDVRNLAIKIKEMNPEVILIPWLLDSPAKHRMVNVLLYSAFKRHNLPNVQVWGYQVHNDLFPNTYVDITSVIENKIRLVKYFESQNNFTQRYDHLALGMAAWNSRYFPSTEEKYYELFFAVPLKAYCDLIKKFYFIDIHKTYRGHHAVLAGMKNFNP